MYPADRDRPAPEAERVACQCEACVLAGCDRPPVTLSASKLYPQRELHGRELKRYWDDVDARKRMLERLVDNVRKGRS
jgi:hypothetical protein